MKRHWIDTLAGREVKEREMLALAEEVKSGVRKWTLERRKAYEKLIRAIKVNASARKLLGVGR